MAASHSIKLYNVFAFLVLTISLFSVNGCTASSKAYSRTIAPPTQDVSLSQFSNLEVKLHSRKAVPISDLEKQRIFDLIKLKIIESDPNIFNEISTEISGPETLLLDVWITKYEKGDSLARSMSAGYGQMHINAIVSLLDKENGTLISKNAVKKTFAWGGIYGGSTTIEDVEQGFVAAIIDIVFSIDS